jgi:hypothetical protein
MSSEMRVCPRLIDQVVVEEIAEMMYLFKKKPFIITGRARPEVECSLKWGAAVEMGSQGIYIPIRKKMKLGSRLKLKVDYEPKKYVIEDVL